MPHEDKPTTVQLDIMIQSADRPAREPIEQVRRWFQSRGMTLYPTGVGLSGSVSAAALVDHLNAPPESLQSGAELHSPQELKHMIQLITVSPSVDHF